MDKLTAATRALDDAQGARPEVADVLIARAQALATIALAEALTRLADRSQVVEATLDVAEVPMPDRDALIRDAASRIDSIRAAGQAGPYANEAARLGLRHATHWPTVVAVEAAVVAARLAPLPEVPATRTRDHDVTRGYL